MRYKTRIILGLLLPGCAWPVLAQYPGRLNNNQKTVAGPRSVAVLEWTGEAGKPSASRLVPVTVYDGGQFQDGALYLARPEPLALESGTEYELDKAGVQEGWFDVDAAQQVSGDWFGFGAWKAFHAPVTKKLQPSKDMPQVVKEHEAGGSGPHFKNGDTSKGDGSKAGAPPASAPDGTKSGDGSANPSKAGNAKQDTAQKSAGSPEASAGGPEATDPERPTLRRRSRNTAAVDTSQAAETPVGEADPDRPRLSHGKPADLPTTPERLETTPIGLQQMVAVSDAGTREPQSFEYQWSDAAEEARVRGQMETVAQKALAQAEAQGGAPDAGIHVAAPASPAPGVRPGRRRTAAGPRASARVLPTLEQVQFHSYALTYSGGATLVLTAESVGKAAPGGAGDAQTQRSVTVIGQPDIYGGLQVLFTSVADRTHPDAQPAMRLVDAVDATGDRRGDLLFELRGATDRRFALYRVTGGRVQQVFSSDPLPLQTATAAEPSKP